MIVGMFRLKELRNVVALRRIFSQSYLGVPVSSSPSIRLCPSGVAYSVMPMTTALLDRLTHHCPLSRLVTNHSASSSAAAKERTKERRREKRSSPLEKMAAF
jgi:hypothetical protein